MTAFLAAFVLGNFQTVFAQFTFTGDYDRAFAAPNGYYTDPEDVDPTIGDDITQFYTGELLADGSIIAGGRFSRNAQNNPGDFYLRKFTATGAVDASFGTSGLVRTNFHTSTYGGMNPILSNEHPQVLKVQADGKILFAGACHQILSSASPPNPDVRNTFGNDACIVRYNANGTLDTTFGGGTLVFTTGTGGSQQTSTLQIDAGKALFITGIFSDAQRFGSDGIFRDMAIQPDGKIVLVGETRNFYSNGSGFGAIIVRLNPNGSLDQGFGAGGIARWNAPQGPVAGCYPSRSFYGVRLQADGRIVAVGYDEITRAQDCHTGTRFVVTRWTSGGQIETARHISDLAAIDTFFSERAVSVHFNRDGSKLLVSGSARNLNGNPAGRQKPTLARFNVSDLSLDASFGNGGIAQYNVAHDNWTISTVYVKAIQPDGKILATDNTATNGNYVRLNPNGSPDLSFGNLGIDGAPSGRGRLRLLVTLYNGLSSALEAGHILVRPNGRINLIGYSCVSCGNGIFRAVVSQQNTTFQNGVYADFENDGKDNISVFRDGNWYWLNSVNNSFNAAQFGISSDKLAPADYDGDGRTDLAVFRNGAWYIIQSSNGAFRALNFGAAGDLPRPGDFDGDGLADISVFRPTDGTWYRLNSSNNQFVGIQFGANGDVPVLADFDADGKTDISVFRAGVWYYIRSSDNQFVAVQFGTNGDIPVVGDYDGDSRADLAVFRPSNGTWYWNGTQAGFNGAQFGANGDTPVPGDYDNDGKNDLAVYRGGAWYIIFSGNNSFTGINFGLANDRPIEAAYSRNN
ncbi:MAG: FG-GAP-like repeat-containing protein [Acidobacteriota bacterium]|nr:FG-GAP-like repeat-containing protein [Acidobacteriota bacterium]